MRIFVAGATGVIGQRLLPMLIAAGHAVTGMTRTAERASQLRSLGAEPVRADAFDRDAMHAALQRARPDVLVHQLTDLRAGGSAANAALRREGTRNLVDAGLAAGVRRIIAQSISWAYEPGEVPAAEHVPLDLEAPEPRRSTVSGIAALEDAVRELPEWVVLRYGLLYGRGTFYTRDGAAGADALAGRLTAGTDVASFVHADDAAAAAAAALAWPSGAVNVCDDEPAAGREWVPEFCRAIGAPAPPVSDAPRAGWARGADNRRARKELGWRPRHVTWRAGFAT